MGMNIEQIVSRWAAWTRGKASAPPRNRHSNVFTRGGSDESLYSYGTHFELARPLRNDRGDLVGYLLNGDTYSVSTSRHQRLVRDVVQRIDVPHLIVPHSALASAGILLDSIRPVDVLPDRSVPVTRTAKERPTFWDQRPITVNGDGTFSWVQNEHRLGESLFTATTTHTQLVPCACGTDPHAAQPRPRCPLGACDRYNHRTLGGSWVAQASGLVDQRVTRVAQYLSGWDHNERRPLYFLSEMPHRKSRTVAEAYEALKPKAVQHAEACGREVLRQGDIFAVPLVNLDKRALRKMGARFERMGQLLTTNHVATEIAVLPDGRTLARGVLHHRPSGREADHARVKLTPGRWHLTVKNTVPLAS